MDFKSPPRARVAFRVGIVGHRPDRLPKDQATLNALRRTLRRVLEAVQTEVANFADADKAQAVSLYAVEPPVLRAISSLAEGADRFFADEAIDIGYELLCPMPFHQNEFEKDFLPPDALEDNSRDTFCDLLRRAREGRGLVTFELDGKRHAAGEAYGMAGRIVLNQSDLLVVVWDRGKAAGSGGTVETLRQAVQFHVPVLWIDPFRPDDWQVARTDNDIDLIQQNDRSAAATTPRSIAAEIGDIVAAELSLPKPSGGKTHVTKLSAADYFAERKPRVNWPAWKIFRDLIGSGRLWVGSVIVADFDGETTKGGGLRGEDGLLSNATSATPSGVEEWVNRRLGRHYTWADKLADFYADRYRSGYLGIYILSALAVLLALVAHLDLFSKHVDSLSKHISYAPLVLGILEFLSVLGIVVLGFRGSKRQWHERWMEYRLLAELIRQIRILIPLGGGHPLPRTPAVSIYEHLTQTWMYWHSRAIARAIGIPGTKVTPEYLLKCLRSIAQLVGVSGNGQRDFHRVTAEYSETISERLHSTAHGLFLLSVWYIFINVVTRILERLSFAEDRIETVALLLAALAALACGAAWLFRRSRLVAGSTWLSVGSPLVVFFLAVVLALSAVLARMFLGSVRELFLVLAALPAFGAALTAIANHGEFTRLAKRSVAMVSTFDQFAARTIELERKLRSGSDVDSAKLSELIALATEITQVMVDEVSDWRIVVAEQPIRLA